MQRGGAAILEIVVQRFEIGLRNGNSGREIRGRFCGGRQLGKIDGNGQRQRRQDGRNCDRGLLRGLDGAFLFAMAASAAVQVALFLLSCLFDRRFLRSERGRPVERCRGAPNATRRRGEQ